MSFRYFAYGSNMLPQRLIDRCPSAKVVCVGLARDHAVRFWKGGMDGSGKATLVGMGGSSAPGVVYEMDLADRDRLDRHEGPAYRRDDAFPVQRSDTRETVLTSTYIAHALDRNVRPFGWYLAILIAGARHHGMDESYIAALRETPFIEDTDPERRTRAAATRAMASHGIHDYRTLLRRRTSTTTR